jgi:RimJ/RimL family protein N-acetyltransferase
MEYAVHSWVKRVALIASIAIGSGIAWVVHNRSAFGEKPYVLYEFTGDERDVQDVEKMFERDLYWLTSRETYDARAMMLRKTSDFDDPSKDGDLTIYIMRDKKTDALIGFTAYLRLSFYKGKILFIAVNPEFRGKRYAGELVKFDFEQFKKMGMIKGMLTTRVDNKAARKAYEREGMKEYMIHDGFVYYEKYV